MFKESLFPLAENSWLAVTLDDSAEHEPPTRDIHLTYAALHLADETVRDLMALVSLPIAADEKSAKEKDRTVAGQREMVERSKGTKSEAHYRDNVLRCAAEAEALRKPTRLMPRWVFPLDGMSVLCVFHIHRQPVLFRVLDLATGRELSTFDGAAVHAHTVGTSRRKLLVVDPAREIEELTAGLDFDRLTDSAAKDLTRRLETLASQQQGHLAASIAPMKIRPLGASPGRLLLNLGMERALVAFEGARFRLLARWPSLHGAWALSARTDQGFIFHCTTGGGEQDIVWHVDSRTGAELGSWPSKGRRVLSTAAGSFPPGEFVALAALGGKVVLQGANADAEAVPKLLGIDKYDSLSVGLSSDGQIVGKCRAVEGNTVALFDRRQRLSASLPLPSMEIHQAPTGRQFRLPGFALGKDSILILAAGRLSVTALASLDWKAPEKPAAPIKKRRTPALTLHTAMESGPLAPIAEKVRSWFRPGVVLTPKRLRGDWAPIGSSKSGGRPDLPTEVEWPRFRGTPMAFMLQLNLKDAADCAPDLGLPTAGLMSLFIARGDDFPAPSFYSDANSDPGGCRVIFTPESFSLTRVTEPADMPAEDYEGRDFVCEYTFRAGGRMLPDLSNDGVQRAMLTTQQSHAYRELVLAVNGDDDAPAAWATRLGGYPAQLQNDDLHLQAETYAQRLALCDSTYARWSEPAFQESAQSWRQLLQLSEGKEGWCWGDAGLMHIMVRGNQWSKAEFSTVWSIGVCH